MLDRIQGLIMAAPRKLPDVATLLALVDEGLTHEEIGARYKSTRQAVTIALRGHRSPRHHKRDWPWEVETRHKAGWLYMGLTYYVITKTHERPLLDREKHRLNTLTEAIGRLERRSGKRWVVDYDATTAHGFYLRPANESDPKDSIVGTPEVTPVYS